MADDLGTLFVVATPIGNLEDVTLRALRVLAEADLVLAEDTRRTRVLLDRHGIRATLVSLHAHNEVGRIDRVLAALDGCGSVALVSDAGTPVVSDPGERLVAGVRDAGHRIEPVPGPSAALAALCASGLPSARFTFVGFPPRRDGERRRWLEELSERAETLILFESPQRVAATLRQVRDVFGPRRACLARELTKLHEEILTSDLDGLCERVASQVKGEVTLVIEGAAPKVVQIQDLEDEIRHRVAAGESAKDIAAALGPDAGISKREIYARAVALRELG